MAWKRLIILFFLFTSLSQAEEFKLKKIISFKSPPWGSTFLNKDEMLITEKEGRIFHINLINKEITEIKHNLNILVRGQGGLLDIIYKNNIVWISYSEDRGNNKASTSIAKGDFNREKIEFKNIFQAEPPSSSGYHFGSRLAIKDNYLFASAGERGAGMIAQDPTKHPGSIIRIHLD